jgi:hypothetical protein
MKKMTNQEGQQKRAKQRQNDKIENNKPITSATCHGQQQWL